MKLIEYLLRIFVKYEDPMYQLYLHITAGAEAKDYSKRYLTYSPKFKNILHRSYARVDKYILERSPQLEFVTDENNFQYIYLDANYSPNTEIRTDNKPYQALFNVLKPLIIELNIKSILEVGCTSGNLLSMISNEFPEIKIQGIDIFHFLREAANEKIRDRILITDLRKPIQFMPAVDLVICLEVAEHIDPSHLDQFMNNIYEKSGQYLIMSWSSSFPPIDAPPQHVSPLWKFQYKRILRHWSFKINKKATRQLKKRDSNELNFHKWWLDSITVWDKNDL